MPYRLSFVINSLSVGGAQMMVLKLLSRIDRERFIPEVISLTTPGELGSSLMDLGIPVWSLHMSRGFPHPRYLLNLVRHLRKTHPDLIQTWMYHADFMGGMAALFAKRPPVIWNIRHSNLDAKIDKKTTLFAAKACALTSSYLPTRIVCCAQRACEMHVQLGYDYSKMSVIPNGFDVKKFCPSPAARVDVRKELGIPQHAIIIGCVSRFHPMKDHQNFIQAAAMLKEYPHDVHYVLCGDDVVWENAALSGPVRDHGLGSVFHLLGRRADIPRLTAAFDIAALPSACGEAFSNIIGEAMASAVPCAVTDVGDAAYIVDDTGIVVPPRRPDELAAAWHKLILMGEERRQTLGTRARDRVLSLFSLDTVVTQYQDLYVSTLQSAQHP